MTYAQVVERELRKRKIEPGDRVAVSTAAGSFEGILLPRIESGSADALIIKLDSGYNAGVKFDAKAKIEKRPEKTVLEKTQRRPMPKRDDLPKIGMVATGGTIASRVDYRMGGVKTILSPEEIFYNAPELAGIASFDKISRPFTAWSENMTPKEWSAIAKETAKLLNSGVDGAIVTHGTDTLHYTAAALSFMLKNLGKPVALVGAQRSPDRGSFDGAMNLACAAHYAGKSGIAEVATVMHGTGNDDYCIAIRGTKVRKMHTSRRDAFRPINDLPLARVWPDGRIEKLQEVRPAHGGKVEADVKFEEKTALVKAYPGSPPELIEFLIEKKFKGIVVEATALGQVSTYTLDKKFSWTPAIKRAVDEGVTVAFATQCLYGTTSPYVYEPARLMQSLGVIHCQDMLPEVAYVKLGFVLGHESKPEKVRELMLTNVAGEINERLTEKHFLV